MGQAHLGGWTGRCALNDRPQIRLFAAFGVTVSQLPTRATRNYNTQRVESLHMYPGPRDGPCRVMT